jgi:hypothetical protein
VSVAQHGDRFYELQLALIWLKSSYQPHHKRISWQLGIRPYVAAIRGSLVGGSVAGMDDLRATSRSKGPLRLCPSAGGAEDDTRGQSRDNPVQRIVEWYSVLPPANPLGRHARQGRRGVEVSLRHPAENGVWLRAPHAASKLEQDVRKIARVSNAPSTYHLGRVAQPRQARGEWTWSQQNDLQIDRCRIKLLQQREQHGFGATTYIAEGHCHQHTNGGGDLSGAAHRLPD